MLGSSGWGAGWSSPFAAWFTAAVVAATSATTLSGVGVIGGLALPLLGYLPGPAACLASNRRTLGLMTAERLADELAPPAPVEFVSTSVGEIAVRRTPVRGDGPHEPAVLVHGLGGNSLNWVDLADGLRRPVGLRVAGPARFRGD